MGELQHPLLRQPAILKEPINIPEIVRHGIGIEIRVTDDFSPIVDAINTQYGVSLASRKEGYHITVITPKERGWLRRLTQNNLDQLHSVYEDVVKNNGIEITGVGYIDGSKRPDIQEKDASKKTAYLSLSIPKLAEFRKSIGLTPKDFHITLGVEGDDIHDHILSTKPNGTNVIDVISKKADPTLQSLAPSTIHTGNVYVLQSLKPYVITPIR